MSVPQPACKNCAVAQVIIFVFNKTIHAIRRTACCSNLASTCPAAERPRPWFTSTRASFGWRLRVTRVPSPSLTLTENGMYCRLPLTTGLEGAVRRRGRLGVAPNKTGMQLTKRANARHERGGSRGEPFSVNHCIMSYGCCMNHFYRVEAAGGRVEPKKLPSGKTVGEPRLWLQHIPSPGLLLSR